MRNLLVALILAASAAISFGQQAGGGGLGGGNATSIQGTPVSATAPVTNQVLQYNGTNYAPAAIAGSGTVNSATAFSPTYYTATGTTVGGVTPFVGLPWYTTSAAPAAATSANVQTTIGAGVYDASGAAATAQTNAENFTSASYAPLASPAFTGTPTAPTAAAATNTTQVASTAYVQNQSTVNGGTLITSVGTSVVLTGQTSTANFGETILTSAPAGLYEICPTVSVTASTLSAGTIQTLWETTKSWSANGVTEHTLIGASSLTAVADFSGNCTAFYSQAGATISVQYIFASIGTGAATYNIAAVLKRLQ
jgi:hypothetical protein